MVTSVPMVLGKALHPGALKEVLAKLSLEEKRQAEPPPTAASPQSRLRGCWNRLALRPPLVTPP